MKILVLNCGSSSLKYQVLDMKDDNDYTLLAKGLVERIGLEKGDVTHRPTGKDRYCISEPIPDHTAGIRIVLSLLTDPVHGVLSSLGEIEAVGHRVAHGGELFPESCLVDQKVIDGIESLCELAPLHNPANLLGIRAASELMPSVPQVAVFDTSFHQTMPEEAYLYAIPYEYYEKYRVRRYGFHGTSHKYVSAKAAALCGLDLGKSRIITCHLGNGSSITAIKDGKSIDTSMGFTPTEGVVMGTRCGNIDCGVVTFLQEKEGLTPAQVTSLLNKKSGLQGISGTSSDCRDLVDAAASGNKRAALALAALESSVLKYIGSYAAEMGGVDLIIFTGGIGENNPDMRRDICTKLAFMGVEWNEAANAGVKGEDKILTAPDSKVKVMCVSTNEELVIARDTMRLSK